MGIMGYYGRKKEERIAQKNKRRKQLGKEVTEIPTSSPVRNLRERISFTLSDKRSFSFRKDGKGESPVQYRYISIAIYLVGLIVFVLPAFTGSWSLLLLGVILFFTFIVFAYTSASKILKKREEMIRNYFMVIRGPLGLKEGSPEGVLKVVEWRDDMVSARRIDVNIPTTFDQMSEDRVLRSFNQFFGRETAWVARSDKEGEPGWDYENFVLRLIITAPLPQRANWDEKYITSPGVPWSFFPIGLGIENGIEMLNAETGKMEYVIGYDVTGLTGKEAKKHGMNVSPMLAGGAAPMVLIAGGTGSGKALPVDTELAVYVDEA